MGKKQKRRGATRVKSETLTPDERLSAICWAAREAGISYGKYCATISSQEREKIYIRYAELLNRKVELKCEENENTKKENKGIML